MKCRYNEPQKENRKHGLLELMMDRHMSDNIMTYDLSPAALEPILKVFSTIRCTSFVSSLNFVDSSFNIQGKTLYVCTTA